MSAANQGPTLLQVHQYVLDRADRQVAVQVQAVANRMGWLILSQAFLMGAFLTSSNVQPPGFGVAVETVVTMAGCLTCMWLRAGINAALSAMDKAKRARQPHIEYLERELNAILPAVQLEDCEHKLGNLPARRIPTLLFCVWIVLTVVLLWRVSWLMMGLGHTAH